jgi:esterase/lipase
MARNKKRNFIIVLAALVLIYVLGPTPDTPEYSLDLPDIPSTPDAIETYVLAHERAHKIKPDNEARVVWNDPENREKTPYSLVYLHGFSASQGEGESIHRDFAKKYGCNLYLSRLADHGIDTTTAMYYSTADRMWESAKEAYAIGAQLGDSVILMGTSTGCTLALMLAEEYPKVAGVMNYSPNIEVNDPNAWLLNNPWGLQIAQVVFGGKEHVVSQDTVPRKYWYNSYRLEAIVALQELIETTSISEKFAKITCPIFVGVYYKDEENQDATIKVSAALEMFNDLSTPDSKKMWVEFPNANTHVISNKIYSGSYPEVYEATCNFTESILNIEPVVGDSLTLN